MGLMVLCLALPFSGASGEDGENSFDPTPETSNFQESWARNAPHAQYAQPAKGSGGAESPENHPFSAPLRSFLASAQARPGMTHFWPGPRRRSGEPLRDALGPGSLPSPPAEAYSLWRGVAAPLFLPSAKILDATLPRTKSPSPVKDGAVTELLVGVRIFPGQTPRQALEGPVIRLGLHAGFSLRRAIGYQRIPGTEQMVLIVEGAVPVRQISRVLADPAVVKVAPSPGKTPVVEASAGPAARDYAGFLDFMLAKYPAILLIVLLASLTLGNSFLRRARRRRRRARA